MMSRTRKALFYCIMAIMTLAVIEGMAQAAYYIAYGEFNGAGPSRPQPMAGAGANADGEPRPPGFKRINHPYYGYTRSEAGHPMNQAPPPRRRDGVVLIALLGGSVALQVTPYLQNALEAWFRDNDIPLRPVVLELADDGHKQPQQVMLIANTLSLGGEYDIIVNLDGRNELIVTPEKYFEEGLSPFYPHSWRQQITGLTGAQKLLLSRIYALRQREQRLAGRSAAEPWRRSALYGIVNRYLRERAAAQILALNHELAAVPTDYDLESHGPSWLGALESSDLSAIALRVWYRGSVVLHDLSRTAGAEYHHFQQPNQYVPDSKPLSDWERANAYNPASASVRIYREAYPLLLRLGDELRQRGINYYDLTQIFADNRETLYKDDCCHFNERGYELLAASIVERLAPAFRNRAALADMKTGGGGG